MLSQELIKKVIHQAQISASHSWEYSTVFEALLEYHDPDLSIFNNPFPNGQCPTSGDDKVIALKYVRPFILTNSDKLWEGNGSSSDPSSLGIPALLLGNSTKSDSQEYIKAVERQLNHLLTITPRFANNAISHRDAYPSLWADFVYMVPPFLAYHGVFTTNPSYLKDAVRQCELYHDVLATGGGCWKHIVNPKDVQGKDVKVDEGLWSTSNGWAAAGMARVLATIRKAKCAGKMEKEQRSLVQMTQGILDGAMKLDTDASGLLRNRLDDESWFGEAAGTTLLAATAFRITVLEPEVFGEVYTEWALRKMEVLKRCVDEETGIVAPVVNPTTDDQRTPLNGVSPEAQAFVVLLYAAWTDWKKADNQSTS